MRARSRGESAVSLPIDPALVAVAERRDQLRQDVVCGFARGLSLREIAAELGVSYTAARAAWFIAWNPTGPFRFRRIT
jgi:AcrR family transcriptional regulator